MLAGRTLAKSGERRLSTRGFDFPRRQTLGQKTTSSAENGKKAIQVPISQAEKAVATSSEEPESDHWGCALGPKIPMDCAMGSAEAGAEDSFAEVCCTGPWGCKEESLGLDRDTAG